MGVNMRKVLKNYCVKVINYTEEVLELLRNDFIRNELLFSDILKTYFLDVSTARSTHMKTHLGGKPHDCRHCNQSIRQSQGVIYFKCSLCGKGLPRLLELRKHILAAECKNHPREIRAKNQSEN